MIELENTREFLNSLYRTPDYKIKRPIASEEYRLLTEKIVKARVIANFQGVRIDYPTNPFEGDNPYPQGHIKEREIKLDRENVIRFGIDIFTDSKGSLEDYYLHFLTNKENLRLNGFTDGTFSLKVTDTHDENKIYSTNRKKLIDMNNFVYNIFSELLDEFIARSEFRVYSEAK